MMMPDKKIRKPLDLLRYMQNWTFCLAISRGSDNYEKKN